MDTTARRSSARRSTDGGGGPLAARRRRRHTMRMKRTNLVLDEHLLEEATRVTGEKTYSAAVNRALDELVKRAKARRILDLRGSGTWDGDLAEMRGDARRRKRP
jgi:Arc/MetJ family transcription regulator